MAQAFSERFGCRIREIYGLTESAGLGSANRLPEPYRPGSAGRAYFNTDIRIVGDDDQPLPAGARGEIVLRGPSIMKGYHNQLEQTAETLRGGWLHTGDVGYLDADGYLFIVDRKKDMILRGGENIYPAEIESILYRHPGVAEAAVVGVPDQVYGEAVVAYVVARETGTLTEQERSITSARTRRRSRPRPRSGSSTGFPRAASGRSCAESCGTGRPAR